ncbi:hypothetical protein BTVI_20103 [Pitangus sulphuratus]|nr:hypothetical protein BTVI_20103 [Pitangus sulphuratus]
MPSRRLCRADHRTTSQPEATCATSRVFLFLLLLLTTASPILPLPPAGARSMGSNSIFDSFTAYSSAFLRVRSQKAVEKAPLNCKC